MDRRDFVKTAAAALPVVIPALNLLTTPAVGEIGVKGAKGVAGVPGLDLARPLDEVMKDYTDGGALAWSKAVDMRATEIVMKAAEGVYNRASFRHKSAVLITTSGTCFRLNNAVRSVIPDYDEQFHLYSAGRARPVGQPEDGPHYVEHSGPQRPGFRRIPYGDRALLITSVYSGEDSPTCRTQVTILNGITHWAYYNKRVLNERHGYVPEQNWGRFGLSCASAEDVDLDDFADVYNEYVTRGQRPMGEQLPEKKLVEFVLGLSRSVYSYVVMPEAERDFTVSFRPVDMRYQHEPVYRLPDTPRNRSIVEAIRDHEDAQLREQLEERAISGGNWTDLEDYNQYRYSQQVQDRLAASNWKFSEYKSTPRTKSRSPMFGTVEDLWEKLHEGQQID